MNVKCVDAEGDQYQCDLLGCVNQRSPSKFDYHRQFSAFHPHFSSACIDAEICRPLLPLMLDKTFVLAASVVNFDCAESSAPGPQA